MHPTHKTFATLIVAVLALIVVFLTGCAQESEAAGTTAVSPAAETEIDVPAPVTAAREAALAFLREGANECVPSVVAKWQATTDPVNTPAGFSVYRFTSDECTITVSYALEPTAAPLYHVALGDVGTGFCWQAVVNANGKIQKTGNAAAVEDGPGNPAALYCQAQGYEYEIRTNDDGTQCGECVFPDGSSCKSWSLFHGECQPGDVTLNES